MYCDNQTRCCGIVSCYSNLYIGKISSASTSVQVTLENTATGRTVVETVTTDGDGVVLLPSGTWSKFLTGSPAYKVRVFLNGVNQDIYPYLTTTTFDSNTYNCLIFDTYTLRESDGTMYTNPTQYLFKSQ